jgi:hypothetical protein
MNSVAKTIFGVVGAAIGAAFGLILAVAIVRLLNQGNTVGEGFMFLIAGPLGLLTGIVVGALAAVRVIPYFRANAISDAERRSKRQMLLGTLLGIPAAFVAIIWVARQTVEPPSDSTMLRHFDRKESTFTKLVDMASEDKGLVRIDSDWTMPADTQSVGVSPERLVFYRKLLRDADTPRGLKAEDTGFDFYFWLRGSAISDDTDKGFAYRAIPPPNIVQSLDSIRPDSKNPMIAYRHIRGNWYLFYEYIPD